jgi:hypothetical protein
MFPVPEAVKLQNIFIISNIKSLLGPRCLRASLYTIIFHIKSAHYHRNSPKHRMLRAGDHSSVYTEPVPTEMFTTLFLFSTKCHIFCTFPLNYVSYLLWDYVLYHMSQDVAYEGEAVKEHDC